MNEFPFPMPIEPPPTRVESLFLGLIREAAIAEYVGRASELSDEELRALLAIAEVALRKGLANRTTDSLRSHVHQGQDAAEAIPQDRSEQPLSSNRSDDSTIH